MQHSVTNLKILNTHLKIPNPRVKNDHKALQFNPSNHQNFLLNIDNVKKILRSIVNHEVIITQYQKKKSPNRSTFFFQNIQNDPQFRLYVFEDLCTAFSNDPFCLFLPVLAKGSPPAPLEETLELLDRLAEE